MEKENLTVRFAEEQNNESNSKADSKEMENRVDARDNQETISPKEETSKVIEKKNNSEENSNEGVARSDLHVKTSEDGEEEGKENASIGSEEWFKEDQKKFKSAYPDLNSEELFSDPIFLAFAEKRAGVESMVDIYGTYLNIWGQIEAKVMEKAEREFKTRLANAKASPGSLTDGSVVQDRLYTLEELKRMSPEAIERNWEKVQKSMKTFGK